MSAIDQPDVITLPEDLRPRLERALAVWLPWQRWFGAKGRPVSAVELIQATELADERASGGPLGLLAVVTVHFADGAETERYLVPLGLRATLPDSLAGAVIAGFDGCVLYDATGDPELNALLLLLIGKSAQRGNVHFVPELSTGFAGASRRGLVGRPLGAEQSNTSVRFGDRYLLKLFRRATEGVNPDLAAHRALRRARSRHIATLLGAIEGELAGEPATFGMLQSFAANATEGWAMALASLRDLFAAPDAPAAAGADFAAEARRLGSAVAAVHADLARELGSSTLGVGELARLSQDLLRRLDFALSVVPDLAPYADPLRAAFLAVADLPAGVPVQRVHGDLHLGQVLRTPATWLVIDFEGEPAAPIAERIAPQSPLRDVAGMLRSFDYAAQHQLRLFTGSAAQLRRLADEWTRHNRDAFLAGYAEAAGADPAARQALLTAFELDKAVYEAVYETRNRPDWVDIPLRAVRRLVGQEVVR
ncbi:maltokinase N-terminal cap-like domain-containing protein [Actinokineospora iranica]|uniref:Maltokinase n=1 Tax=Actinokineospora iranica TaxID=1271860 RepID=A0A1G6QG93_9PSEU|nr:phosphotransferase [Actinokineospora iranica]SDC90934.1 maltokinase [Actinokineospora iranica]